jgi:DNA end-binding protein Ku
MWRGAISFGMVAIPVRMYLATEAQSTVSLRMLCPHCQLPIKQQRHCPTDDHVVPFNEVIRGYEVSKGKYVVLDDSDLDKLPLKTTKTIDIMEFVDATEVPLPLYLKSAYYLEPEEVGVKPYFLLKQALQDTGKVAVAKVALRDREHLCLIQVEGKAIMCNTLNWPEEIRSADELNLPEKSVKISDKEVQMANSLIENLSDTFQPQRYTDDYRAAFMQIVEQKLAGQEIVAPTAAAEPKVMDLMAALKASVEAAKQGKKKAGAEPARAAAAGGRRVKVAAKTTTAKPAKRKTA